MVWSLSAENDGAALVPSKYHFTSPGTYKVGRKDCDVILQADRTVSRLHAELTISPAKPWLPADSTTDVPAPELFLKDHSKFGTFVGKTTGAKPVFSSPDRVVSVKDGDLITFGTGNTTFRLSYMPVVFCVSALVDKVKESTYTRAASVGAYVIDNWTKCCTHLLVQDGSEITDDVFAAVIHKKPVIELEWLQAVVARGAPGDDFPAMSSFLPTLMFKGHDIHTTIKISEPYVREAIFQGFVFLIGPSDLYQYGKHMQHLLEAFGGEIQNLSGKNDIPQEFRVSGKKYVVIVPDGAVESQSWLVSTAIPHHVNSTSEGKIIQVALSGQKELFSTILSTRSAGGQTTSASTEETVEVVNSEEDINSAALCNEDTRKVVITTISNVEVNSVTNPSSTEKQIGATNEPNMGVDRVKESPPRFPQLITRKSVAVSKQKQPLGSRMQSGHSPVDTPPFMIVQDKRLEQPSEIVSPLDSKVKYITTQVGETVSIDSSKHIDPSIEAHVQYSCLIVQKDWSRSLSEAANQGSAPNFKLFKKVAGRSGNSYTNLVPFAKEPYRDSDYGREVEEYMQREKKRKEAERLAEDLFNAERLKRQRATSGESLRDSIGISSTLKGMVGQSGRK